MKYQPHDYQKSGTMSDMMILMKHQRLCMNFLTRL